MRKRHGHPLRRSETVFAVEDHAVAAIEEQHGGAGRLILALMDHEVAIVHLERNFGAFAADRVGECFADVEIERVAEFVGAGYAAGFDASGKVTGVVASKTAAAERAE